ncbi:MAG: hypothetical protein IPP72_12625 [Chitinophagaceae bacterium]|nr:hypothetical protein [Chitinophagaceae bacterium]
MKKALIAYLLLLMQSAVYCQDDNATESSQKTRNNADAMLALNVGIPFPAMTRAIQNNMGNMGFGLSGLYLANPFSNKNSPLRLGGEVGYTYYGRFKSDVNVNGYSGDYKTSYGIITLHGIARLRPSYTHRVSPFLDIFAGGNFYISAIKENLGFIESALGLQAFDLGGELSASFSRGIGAGVTIGSPVKDQGRFVLRLSYNAGSPLKYIVRNSLTYDESSRSLVYQTGRASVKYIMLQVGIGF